MPAERIHAHALYPLRDLQATARAAVDHLAPGERASRVVVFGANGSKLIDITVPACATCAAKSNEVVDAPYEVVPPVSGWVVTDRAAIFDGVALPIAGRKLDVLRVLVAHETATVDDLRTAWSDYKAEDSTIRWQVGELKKSLKGAFRDFPGELIEATGSGYKLLLR
jgi:hypothetical protein